MKYFHHLSLSLLLIFVSYCLASEFEYEDTIKTIFKDNNYYNNSLISPEFQPQTPSTTTPRIIKIFKRTQRRNHFYERDSTGSITFPYKYDKPSVKSIKIYQCDNFRMKCEFRPNYNVKYPLHCKME